MQIIKVSERLKEKTSINGVIFGKSGIGKTSLLYTLPEQDTLFVDLEAGGLSVKDWGGDSVTPKTWEDCRDIAVFFNGGVAQIPDTNPYSNKHYENVKLKFAKDIDLKKYKTIFVDSITVAARMCFDWCKQQPQSIARNGTLDTRAAYGLLGQELVKWFTVLQRMEGRNCWLVGILDEKADEGSGTIYMPQIDGSKAALEIPGIFDEVITMASITNSKKELKRVFVCTTLNKWNYPAKDRSGCLNELEPPHLGDLMHKINTTKAKHATKD